MKEIYAEAKTVAVSIVAAVSSVAALCFLMTTAGTAMAQSGSRGTPPTPVERRTEVLNQQAGDYEIEKSSRDLKGPKDPADRRHVQEIAEQIKHDFEGLRKSQSTRPFHGRQRGSRPPTRFHLSRGRGDKEILHPIEN